MPIKRTGKTRRAKSTRLTPRPRRKRNEAKRKRKTGRRIVDWAELPKEQLLDLPIRRLSLHIKGTELEPLVTELHKELTERGFFFRPHIWLSDEWF